jgi:hypothetical protein
MGRRDPLERMRLSAPVYEILIGGPGHPEHRQPLQQQAERGGVAEGQRAQQHCVHHGEDCGVRSYAEGECCNGGCGDMNAEFTIFA